MPSDHAASIRRGSPGAGDYERALAAVHAEITALPITGCADLVLRLTVDPCCLSVADLARLRLAASRLAAPHG
jgi:hypothetical protein